ISAEVRLDRIAPVANLGELVRKAGRRIGVTHVRRCDADSLARKRQRDGTTDPPRSTGYQRAFSSQSKIHRSPLESLRSRLAGRSSRASAALTVSLTAMSGVRWSLGWADRRRKAGPQSPAGHLDSKAQVNEDRTGDGGHQLTVDRNTR